MSRISMMLRRVLNYSIERCRGRRLTHRILIPLTAVAVVSSIVIALHFGWVTSPVLLLRQNELGNWRSRGDSKPTIPIPEPWQVFGNAMGIKHSDAERLVFMGYLGGRNQLRRLVVITRMESGTGTDFRTVVVRPATLFRRPEARTVTFSDERRLQVATIPSLASGDPFLLLVPCSDGILSDVLEFELQRDGTIRATSRDGAPIYEEVIAGMETPVDVAEPAGPLIVGPPRGTTQQGPQSTPSEGVNGQ